jgi:hypothetical protein
MYYAQTKGAAIRTDLVAIARHFHRTEFPSPGISPE